MVAEALRSLPLDRLQRHLHENPTDGILEDYDRIYNRNEIVVGWPHGAQRIFEHLARDNSASIVGVALGDEGKGRLVDNKIETMLAVPAIKIINVVRFQGGNNSGHTIEKDGTKLDLHLVPSGVLYEQAVGIIDRGVFVNAEDLQTEVRYIEDAVGDLRGRLYVSDEAVLNADLERAEEKLNRIKTMKAQGGTGRGVGPTAAHRLDRLGSYVYDLLADNWREHFSERYDRYVKDFTAHGVNLAEVTVPDFKASRLSHRDEARTVGTKEEFLDRLDNTRKWLVEREMVRNIYLMHENIYKDMSQGVLFEGAQAAGLDAFLGTIPDITASDTSVHGVRQGTAYWRTQDIKDRIGVFKVPYTSSVGSRKMPTHIDLPVDVSSLDGHATADQLWAASVREEAHEYGTTTGRPRDIAFLDLAFLSYNAKMSGVEVLAGTHLDIGGKAIKVCTHYTKNGRIIPYQPGLRYQEGVEPQYIELPGWDGEACRNAKSFGELPINARRFLAFVQARTGYPIVAVTTGPKREHMINFSEN